ncbi:MAG: prepilin-type N-terminal cleavage/methylation domain-containing protein [Chthoniobacterales bacterium]
MLKVLRPKPKTGKRDAFTLVELLISMTILVLLLTLVTRIISGTNSVIKASSARIDTASLARIVLDRFDNDFSSVMLSNGATALYYSDGNIYGNSAIAFISGSRARGPSTTLTYPYIPDTRGAFIGYKITPFSQNVATNTVQSIPSLARGDGRLTLGVQDIGNKSTQNLWDLFGTGNLRLPNDISVNPLPNLPIPNPRPDEKAINWQVIANTIFRMHISFVLNDGRIVQTPPAYRNFYSNGGMGSTGCIPIAFSRETSNDPTQAYVKGMIVGLAVLDEKTRNLAYKTDNNFWTTVGTKISRPTADGETPVQFWSQKLATLISDNPLDPTYLFPPVRENLRFYQRFFNVNL